MAEDLLSPSGSPRASLETTPLLFDQPNEDGQDNPSSAEPSSGARPRAPRPILILTLVSLFVSVVCSGLVVSVNIAVGRKYSLPWTLERNLEVALVLTIPAAILSTLNLVWLRRRCRALPLWVNLIPDLAICFYSIAFGVQSLDATFNEYYGYRLPVPIKVLVVLTFGFMLALAITHLILFVMRCVFTYRTRFWERLFRCEAGELTFELTVKLRRQRDNTES